LIHLCEVVTRGLAAGRVPWGNMYEFSSAVALVAVGALLVLYVRQGYRWIGLFVLLPVVLYLGLAGTVLFVQSGPLVPALHSYWIKIHVVAALTATGTLMVGGVFTCLHLIRRRHDRALASGATTRLSRLAERLPPAAALDRSEYRIIAFAFPIWTFAIIAGAIWAESAWGRYWGWDPKETWSFITWVVYAAYLHARTTSSWRRAAPYVALLGFGALMFNYYVVNLVISGLHSYAGIRV
jgi:cytochrome c-type biogenesis protein CcsB